MWTAYNFKHHEISGVTKVHVILQEKVVNNDQNIIELWDNCHISVISRKLKFYKLQL